MLQSNGRDEKSDHDDQQNADQRREIHSGAPQGLRQKPADSVQERIGYSVQELHDGIIGIRLDPRYEGPDDDDPHIEIEHPIHKPHDAVEEVAEIEHSWLLDLEDDGAEKAIRNG